jgi:hypothetical protein
MKMEGIASNLRRSGIDNCFLNNLTRLVLKAFLNCLDFFD